MRVLISHQRDIFPENYIKYAKSVGLEPLLYNKKEDISLLDMADGIIFCGGGDISPQFSSLEPELLKNTDPFRDEAEFELFNKRSDKPVLGICRGMQLVSTALGGTLIPHLPNSGLHYGAHDVFHDFTATGRLKEHFCEKTVNSCHHQAVKTLGKGLENAGMCGDVIEAALGEQIILVQFHPERVNFVGIINFFKTLL